MKKFAFFLLISVFSSLLFAQVDQTTRRRYALVIGNQNYKYSKLSTNVADATKISNALAEKEFDVTFKKNLNTQELKEAVNAFIAKVNSDTHSVSFVYLSGHAFTYNEKNYFLPIDNNKFHNQEEAVSYGIDIENDLAKKINSAGQIYVIDGAYEDPFEAKGSRAIGVKGGLKAAKASRESTVGFLFSTEPEVVIAKKYSSVFADVLASEISSSKENLSGVFNAVQEKVASKTGNEQKPYSSATSLDFSFNGEELIALKKIAAQKEADKTELDSIEMSRKYKAEQEARNAVLAEQTESAMAAKAVVSAEILAKRQAQKEEDERRRLEEEELAQNRSIEATMEIMKLRKEFQDSEATLRESMKKNASAEERVDYIESMKTTLYDIRQTAADQIADYNRVTDDKTREKINEIENRPLKTVEMRDGQMTEEARTRRENEKKAKYEDGEAEKAAYKISKDKEVAEDDKKFLPQIKSAYSKLEGDTYILTSLEDALTVRVDDYDGSLKKWKLHISADLFGHIDVFEDDIYLGYTDVTGKKVKDLTLLSDYEMEKYNEDVEIYDSLFRSGTPIFYVKLYYKVMRWANPSEYHFIPKKCEIIRLGKKNKVITKIKASSLNPTEFSQNPVEIRTEKEIAADSKRATATRTAEVKNSDSYKAMIAEQKANNSSVPVEYSDSYEGTPSYSYDDAPLDFDDSSSSEDGRRGRNTFYVSGDFGSSDLFSKNDLFDGLDVEEPFIYDFQVHLTFNLARFYYWGLSGGVQKWNHGNAEELNYYSSLSEDYKDDLNSKIYFGKFVNGIVIPIGNHFRLFGEGGIGFYYGVYNFIDYNWSDSTYLATFTGGDDDLLPGKDNALGFSLGGGFDIIFTEHFMMTFGFDYNWMHYMRSFKNGVLSLDSSGNLDSKSGFMEALKNPDFHMTEFSVGLGFTW